MVTALCSEQSDFMEAVEDPGWRLLPNGTQFFRFHTRFRRKVPVSDIGTPQQGWLLPKGKYWIRHWEAIFYGIP